MLLWSWSPCCKCNREHHGWQYLHWSWKIAHLPLAYACLEFLREMKLTWEECADILLISRNTLWLKTKELDLTCSSYSKVSTEELDAVMEKLSQGLVPGASLQQSNDVHIVCLHQTFFGTYMTSIVLFGGALWFMEALMVISEGCSIWRLQQTTKARVLRLFCSAVEEYGWPSRIRSDQGGENVVVARAMVSVRGCNCRSHMWPDLWKGTTLRKISSFKAL